jgi:hypothetical protein
MYARIYWSIEAKGSNGQFKFPNETYVDWDRMKKGLDNIILKYPSDWNITHYAYLACRAKDQVKTAELFKNIPDYVRENWPRPVNDENYYFCKFFSENRNDKYFTFLNENGRAVTPVVIKKYKEFKANVDFYRKEQIDQLVKMNPNSLSVEEGKIKFKELAEYLQRLQNVSREKYKEYLDALASGD